MGGQPSTYLACACAALAHFFAIGGTAHAQATDRQILIGIGIAPLSVTDTTTTAELDRERSTTLVQSSLGGPVLLAAGIGLGPWVLAIETAFAHAVARQEQDDAAGFDDETVVNKRSQVTFGPSGRLLFIEGAVRPFVEVGAGFGILRVEADGVTDDGLTLYVRGGGGIQLRLTDAASLDLTLRAGYLATSGEIEPYTPLLGRRFNAATGLYVPLDASSSLEYDVQQITADVAARLSIWL